MKKSKAEKTAEAIVKMVVAASNDAALFGTGIIKMTMCRGKLTPKHIPFQKFILKKRKPKSCFDPYTQYMMDKFLTPRRKR